DPVQPFTFNVRYAPVCLLLGKAIPDGEIKAILEAVGITVVTDGFGVVTVVVSAYRVDVVCEVDIVEVGLGIDGYDRIVIDRQIKASLNTSLQPDREVVQSQVADLLIGNGFREMLSNSLTRMDYADGPGTAVRIMNPLGTDLDTMRQNLLF